MGAGTSGPEDEGIVDLYSTEAHGAYNGELPRDKIERHAADEARQQVEAAREEILKSKGDASLQQATSQTVPATASLTSGAGTSWSLPGGLEAGGSSSRAEVQRLGLGRSSSLFSPTPNLVRMAPKGARAVDSKPVMPPAGDSQPLKSSFVSGFSQEGNLRSAGYFARSASPLRRRDPKGKGAREQAQELQPLPMRPTRASLESTNAGLRASINSSHVLRETLALKAKALREALQSGSGTLLDLDNGGLTSALSSMSWEAQLDRQLEKIRAHVSVSERHQLEIATLRQDFDGQARRAKEAVQRKTIEQDLLQKGRQECSELARKARTEQLRVVMLREAFEQEQTRVGESLGRAESFVCDLVAATEGTRKVEVEEQSLARECVSALSEIHAAEARDELATEARLAQARQELNTAEAALANGVGKNPMMGTQAEGLSAAAAYAKVESERHSATLSLNEERRRCQGAKEIARRCAATEDTLRKELEMAREKSKAIGKLLVAALNPDGKSSKGQRSAPGRAAAILAPRLHLEEQNEEALSTAEARLRGELEQMQRGGGTSSGGVRRRTNAANRARECSTSLSTELAQVKAELTDSNSIGVTGRSRSPQPGQQADPDWRLDLEAAGLQRKIGKVLAAERQSYCLLLEMQHSEPKVEGAQVDTEELNGLLQQVKVLKEEASVKDEQIARLQAMRNNGSM